MWPSSVRHIEIMLGFFLELSLPPPRRGARSRLHSEKTTLPIHKIPYPFTFLGLVENADARYTELLANQI
jgi:hypothetical protein